MFFKENKFFKDFLEQNGEEALMDCYRCLKYEMIKKGEFVMKQGDFGDTYYIIINGLTSVMVNMEITKKWTIHPPGDLSEKELEQNIKDF